MRKHADQHIHPLSDTSYTPYTTHKEHHMTIIHGPAAIAVQLANLHADTPDPDTFPRILAILDAQRCIPAYQIVAYLTALSEYDYDNMRRWPADNPITRALQPEVTATERELPRWADHAVMESHNGRTVYACHPYHLQPEAFRDLIRLEDAGLDVHITGYSDYHPGAIRVAITTA